MPVGFRSEVVSLTDLKTNPGRVVKHTAETHRPVLVTSRGRGVAVVQSVADFEPPRRNAPSCAPWWRAWPIWMRDARSVWRRPGHGSA